ncbi:MAG TPA: hypothetical protein V6D17_11430 [Candidatus Obscuribacterales bacterium]
MSISGGGVSANDGGTRGYNHYVAIATRQLTVTNTVTLAANGKGIDTTYPAVVLLGGEGSLIIPDVEVDPATPLSPPTWSNTASTLTVNGSGNLVLEANGAQNRVSVVAQPISFTNSGTLTLKANEGSSNKVYIINPGSFTNTVSLSFTGGTVTMESNNSNASQNAGGIEISVDKLGTISPAVTLNANGGKDGGSVVIALVARSISDRREYLRSRRS